MFSYVSTTQLHSLYEGETEAKLSSLVHTALQSLPGQEIPVTMGRLLLNSQRSPACAQKSMENKCFLDS